jgi:GNAT superfamily N-acetyltransferase
MKLRIRSDEPDGEVARALIDALLDELAHRYGAPDIVDDLASGQMTAPTGAFVVATLDDDPVGCGGIRRVDDTTAEIKRMYVVPDARCGGTGAAILRELEVRALGMGYEALRLETGTAQPEAVALYEGHGYERITSYGPYADRAESVCLEKQLPHA